MTGRSNSLAKQVGEHLVCAELGRRGYLATPFAGSAPTFDVLAADERCRTVPIQVKATRGPTWPTNIRKWMRLDYNPQTGVQHDLGPVMLANPELVYVCVAIAAPGVRDRFFVLTESDLQKIIIDAYSCMMKKHNWKRPKKPDSYDCRYPTTGLQAFEDNWSLIAKRLQPVPAIPDSTGVAEDGAEKP